MPDPLVTLAAAQRDLEDARAVVLHRLADRDRMILHALSVGAAQTTVAEIAGLTRQRVDQLVRLQQIKARTYTPDQEDQ